MLIKKNNIKFGLIIFLSFNLNIAQASTPSEMAGFSLQDLLSLSIDETDGSARAKPWKLNILYKQLRLDGYQIGDSSVSNNDVLFDVDPASGDIRTDENFPILPTVITQEVYLINLGYAINNKKQVSVSIPYILQGTDHISSVENYDEFLIESSGIGDITLNYDQQIKQWDNQQVTAGIGVSIPLGSIDRRGDTPRDVGDQQLPYTMQIGSGTWDFPFNIRYQNNSTKWNWGTGLSGKLRIGKNDRNYRLGNSLGASIWTKKTGHKSFSPKAKLQYLYWDRIQGQDDELLAPNPNFPFGAAIHNPRNFGGQKININLGTEYKIGSNVLSLELGTPLYQNLNGVQNKEKFHTTISWGTEF